MIWNGFPKRLAHLSDGSNYICLKFDVRSLEAKNSMFEFDYQKMNKLESIQCSKIDVRVCSMNNLVKLVKV